MRRKVKHIRKIHEITSKGVKSEDLPKIFDLLYQLVQRKSFSEEEKENLIFNILKQVEAQELVSFAKKQTEIELKKDEQKLFCTLLYESGSFINPLSRETEEISNLLGKLCGKVPQTIFKINLKQNIVNEKRAISLKLISLIGRKLSALLEEFIMGTLTDSEAVAEALERKRGREKIMQTNFKRIAESIGMKASSISVAEFLNSNFNEKEAFISNEFPQEVTTHALREGSLTTELNALVIIYNLLCSKNLKIERFKELLRNEFNKKNFTAPLKAIVYSTIQAHSREWNRGRLHTQMYLRNNLDALIHIFGKEHLLITESLEKKDFRWIQGFVWGKLFEEYMGNIRIEALNAFTDLLGDLVEANPLYVIKAIRSLVSLNIREKTIQKIFNILPKALSLDEKEAPRGVSHQVAQIIRDLTFSSSINDLSRAASTTQGKKAIIKIILEGSSEVINEVLRLFKLSSTSQWLFMSSQEEPLNLDEETEIQLEKKLRATIGEQTEEILLSLIGKGQSE